jgi:Ca2+/Na+ antiporter
MVGVEVGVDVTMVFLLASLSVYTLALSSDCFTKAIAAISRMILGSTP